MTQQRILIFNSSPTILNSLSVHIKNAIFSNIPKDNEFVISHLHNELTNNRRLMEGSDQDTLFHKAVYSTFDLPNFYSTEFWKCYKKLCLKVTDKLKIQTGYYGEWSIQRYPTLRFHFPSNISVYEFHRDNDYGHPLGEINCFYAISECKNSSALHVEKNLGFEDYEPLNLKSGEYALLNTSIYKHGDLINETGETRVSMDFRFIPEKQLTETKSSLTKAIKFTSDSYFVKERDMINL